MKTRGFAAFVAAVTIILSVWLGGYRSLTKLRSEVDAAFENGVAGDGFSIARDLSVVTEQTYNLGVIASKYISAGGDEFARSCDALASARDRLAKAVTPSEKYSANADVYEAAADVYLKLKDLTQSSTAPGAGSDTNARLAAQYYTEILSRGETMKNDGYNDAAKKYNATLGSFPTSYIAALTGVKRAELFA